MNKEAFKLAGVTEDDFRRWCKENKKPMYLQSSKTEFFARIQDGRLAKDNQGKFVKKHRTK